MDINNVRISKQSIEQIARMLDSRYKKFKDLYEKHEEFQKNTNYAQDYEVKPLVVSSRPNIMFEVVTKNHQESQADVEWFVSMLYSKSNEIEKVSINYSCYYAQNTSSADYYKAQRSDESVNITFMEESIYYNNHQEYTEQQFSQIISEIDALIYNAPRRLDSVVTAKSTKKTIPSMVVSFAIGMVISVIVFVLFRFDILDFGIKNLVLSFYFGPFVMLCSFVLGFSVPGKNHALYRKLNLKQRYVGYDKSSKSDVYTEDYRNIENGCEVEIGKFSDNGEIRDAIEKNYAKAKKILIVEVVAFIVLSVIFAIL